MQQIPRISQVPINEPIYTNGIMNTAWIRFFEKLVRVANTGEVADGIALMQLSSQLPTQSIAGQAMLDSQVVAMPMVATFQEPVEHIPTVSTAQTQSTIEMPFTTPTLGIINYATIP